MDLKDPWGLKQLDKAEGIRRAMNSPPTTTPGTHFEYSDINFIVLGALVEKLSGQTLSVYASEHIFHPLGMSDTSFHPPMAIAVSRRAHLAPTEFQGVLRSPCGAA